MSEHRHSNERVVVAMSGGVDSSVAAALLVEQGYDVVGIMMRLWSEPGVAGSSPVNRCCTPDQMADARRVADHLNIPFYVLDVQDLFRQSVVQYFIDEHERGVTPNPCILCNRQIRFSHLFDHAMALDARYLATGHYARIRPTTEGAFQLRRAVDEHKDQSYVLHVLSQKHLAHVLFPIGDYTKEEVRDLARDFGLPVATKQDSQDLCFLGDGDYRRFLRDYAPSTAQPGPILTSDGHYLGEHNGLTGYTIGQRKGLGLSTTEPVFVIRKDVGRNALIVGERSQLGQRHLSASEVNWVGGAPPAPGSAVQVKIRYKAPAVPATVIPGPNQTMRVEFDEPVMGLTPGQGAVVYDGETCLGGGLIEQPGGTDGLEPTPRAIPLSLEVRP